MAGTFERARKKMVDEGLSESIIKSFEASFNALASGASGKIPESTIGPAATLTDLDKDIIPSVKPDPSLLSKTVVLKLNGGLGTGMGLDKAKSLLTVKGDETFLDFSAKQVSHMREKFGNVKFMLMNSFSTSEDTMAFLGSKYPDLSREEGLEMMQNKVPKLDATTLQPATCESNRDNEWCPPGHGDLYSALVGTGRLDSLLSSGIKYMFVSNSDNLGATLDLSILTHFATSDAPFMMECCVRTENDKKGGHLAVRECDGQLILRESAMCADEDTPHFQNIEKYKYFNTNNLWIRLDKLKEIVNKFDGFVPLPMIKNMKTVDPKDPDSQKVVQLETAMGAAIECFEGATAITVNRTRFAPVKKSDDLILLRSDAYTITDDFRPVLNPLCNGKAPIVSLDSKCYKMVGDLEKATRYGVPSLVNCTRLTIKGEVWLSRRCIFEGDINLVNTSSEPKFCPGRLFSNSKVDLTAAPGLGPLKPVSVSTSPIEGQKPGTSGLRKKTKIFQSENYLQNFVQSTLNAVVASGTDITEGSLLIGGDGRFFNPEAIQIIVKMAAANGVRRIWIGENGLLSTPAVSAIVRERGPVWQRAFGAFILTASHNPGGPDEDFGIKYNGEHGQPAVESVTNAIFANTKTISSYQTCPGFPEVDISSPGSVTVTNKSKDLSVAVEVISTTDQHVALLKNIFDFPAIKALLSRDDFAMVYDSMHGVNGPYARAVFCGEFGLPEEAMMNSTPKNDFNGGHADPNLTYAKELVAKLGLTKTGEALPVPPGTSVPNFGAAADGDGDRNMILGNSFFVTPSDSLAVIAANANAIPFFASQGGLKSVARSMPTSGAVDRVAKELNLSFFETPTGWKFFGNLMDSKALFGKEDFCPLICGEESFGTGSNHVREKDGIWAVLAWLNILASKQRAGKPLVSVESIVRKHWSHYGRNYYCRYDYEGMDKVGANKMFDKMRADRQANTGRKFGSYEIATADEFQYHDPIDGSVSKQQGIRFLFSDGSRIIFRLSGTAGSGATVRCYLEKYEPNVELHGLTIADALGDLVPVALQLCDIKTFCGTETPTVIT